MEDKDNGNEQKEPATQHEFAEVFQAGKRLNYSISDYNSRKHEEHFSLHNQLKLNRIHPFCLKLVLHHQSLSLQLLH
jgi:hypothetical protein